MIPMAMLLDGQGPNAKACIRYYVDRGMDTELVALLALPWSSACSGRAIAGLYSANVKTIQQFDTRMQPPYTLFNNIGIQTEHFISERLSLLRNPQETGLVPRLNLSAVSQRIEETEPSAANRFMISSLTFDNANQRMFAPRMLYPNPDEARRAAQQYLQLDRPMYILEVVEKLELAPPPTISTDFRAQG